MPSKTDKAFIDNLQNFTTSLENVVELLKEEQKKGDAINKMLSNMDGEKIAEISKDIKEILEVSTKIDNRTKEILNEVKAARKEKESGMFGQIESKDNKDKIVGGINTVMLIAAGVLAIGLAFKLVGHIDFVSVLSLSIGIMIVAKAFGEISNIKNLTYKKVAMVGLSVIAIAASLTASSFILQQFQPISKDKMISLVFVGGALGVATYLIAKALPNISAKPKDLLKYALLPLILPAIAGGIVLSSMVLTNMQPVGLGTAISVAFVGLALGAASIGIGLVMKALGDKIDFKKILAVTMVVPLLAGGIVAASYIFNYFQPLTVNPVDLVISSLAMGLALLTFTPTVMLLGKLNPKDLLIGALGAILVSGAIVASSYILSYGKYTGGPTPEWTLGTGLALIGFTPAVMVLGILAMTGIGALAIVAGAALTTVVSGAIVASSHILKEGIYENYPGIEWAIGTGLALIGFTPAIMALGMIAMTGFGALAIVAGAALTTVISGAIVESSHILAGGNYTGGPTKEWAEGIGLSLSAFAYALSVSSETSLFSKKIDTNAFSNFMMSVARSMIGVSDILGDHKWDGKYPSKKWGEGVATSLTPFIDAYAVINENKSVLGSLFGGDDDSFTVLMTGIADAMVKVSKKLADGTWSGAPSKKWSKDVSGALSAFVNGLGKLDEDKVELIDDFSDAITNLAKSVEKLNMSGIDKLNNLTSSITIMSAVDESNLNRVLGVLDSNKAKISNVIDGGTGAKTTSKKQESIQLTPTGSNTLSQNITPEQEMSQKFDLVLEKFDQVLEHMIQNKSGENVNKADGIN